MTTTDKDYLIEQAERKQANRKEAYKDFESRMKDIKEAQENEEKREELLQNLLDCECNTVYRLLLTCGGPTSQFYITMNNGEFISGEYVTTDNPDGEQVTYQLSNHELDTVIEFYGHLLEVY